MFQSNDVVDRNGCSASVIVGDPSSTIDPWASGWYNWSKWRWTVWTCPIRYDCITSWDLLNGNSLYKNGMSQTDTALCEALINNRVKGRGRKEAKTKLGGSTDSVQSFRSWITSSAALFRLQSALPIQIDYRPFLIEQMDLLFKLYTNWTSLQKRPQFKDRFTSTDNKAHGRWRKGIILIYKLFNLLILRKRKSTKFSII